MADKIKTVALTGGACSGKTTFLNLLKEVGQMCGYRMLFVPEAATMLSTHGMSFGDGEKIYQRAILSTQHSLEGIYKKYAEEIDGNVCIVCDRGALDGSAYCGWDKFDELLDEENLTRDGLLSGYDGVIYMVSAAIGAPEHYGNDTNEMRRESLQEAIELEYETLKCWKDHPYIAVIDNEGGKSFNDKLDEAMSALRDVLDRRS